MDRTIRWESIDRGDLFIREDPSRTDERNPDYDRGYECRLCIHKIKIKK